MRPPPKLPFRAAESRHPGSPPFQDRRTRRFRGCIAKVRAGRGVTRVRENGPLRRGDDTSEVEIQFHPFHREQVREQQFGFETRGRDVSRSQILGSVADGLDQSHWNALPHAVSCDEFDCAWKR